MDFESWLARLFDEDVADIKTFLANKRALHFLISWSLFESKCFNGFMRKGDIDAFAKNADADTSFDKTEILKHANSFHNRYQDKTLYGNLLYKDSCPRMDALLKLPYEKLDPEDAIYLATFTVYRYRNNIFHGNKGVSSWLQFEDQIDHCTEVMKTLIDQAERKLVSLHSVPK